MCEHEEIRQPNEREIVSSESTSPMVDLEKKIAELEKRVERLEKIVDEIYVLLKALVL